MIRNFHEESDILIKYLNWEKGQNNYQTGASNYDILKPKSDSSIDAFVDFNFSSKLQNSWNIFQSKKLELENWDSQRPKLSAQF